MGVGVGGMGCGEMCCLFVLKSYIKLKKNHFGDGRGIIPSRSRSWPKH